jgi:chromosome segregation ATPase
MEKKGIRTERGDINRAIEITNREWRQLKARLSKLEKWVSEEASNARPPTLADVIDEVMSRQGQSSLTRLKNGVEIFNFLMDNKVNSMEDLEKKVSAMQDKLSSTRTELKKVERRIDTLKEHIRHSENFKNYRKLKARYEELYSRYTAARKMTGFGAERKAQKALDAANAYYDTHRSELAMFDNAEKYLRDVLQERFDPNKLPTIAKWREDLAVKTTVKDSLYREYYTLKDETAKVEKIKRSVTEILHSDTPGRKSIWVQTQDVEI